jgi:hypothetical protein
LRERRGNTHVLTFSKHKGWETLLAPRLILGLWHPIFIRPALKYLSKLRRYHIGLSTWLARTYFWEACEGFSMNFGMLVGSEGQAFIRDCRAAGKEVCVWTVNDPNETRTAMTWGIKAILTDKVAAYIKLKDEVSRQDASNHRSEPYSTRAQIVADSSKIVIPGITGYLFLWSHWRYYTASHVCVGVAVFAFLRSHGTLHPPPSLDTDTADVTLLRQRQQQPQPQPLTTDLPSPGLVAAHAA